METDRDDFGSSSRLMRFRPKLPLVRRRHRPALYNRAPTEQWNLLAVYSELLRREKGERSEKTTRHRIKKQGFPNFRYLNKIDTDALPRCPESRPTTRGHSTSSKTDATSFYTANPGTGKTHLRSSPLVSPMLMPDHSVLFNIRAQDCSQQIRECRNATLRSLGKQVREIRQWSSG